METIRDIVVIVFGVTGTITSLVLLIVSTKLYGRASQALERVGIAAEDIHGAAEGARSRVRLAKGVFEVMSPVLPGLGWLKLTSRGAAALPEAVRFISRIKKSSTPRP